MMEDDEDSFLYGDAPATTSAEPSIPVQKVEENVEFISVPAETIEKQTNGVVAHLEAKVELEDELPAAEVDEDKLDQANGDEVEGQNEAEDEEQDEQQEAEEDSDDDIEFILEPPKRSLDFRGAQRPAQARTSSVAPSTGPPHGTNLTTEYTPRERGAPPDTFKPPAAPGQDGTPQIPSATPAVNVSEGTSVQPTAAQQPPVDEGPDPSTLPPVRAPHSAPHIDPSVPGTYEGRSIFEVDITNMAEKPWRRPGSDISDWFNYGFDEISWEAYCYRRRTMGEMADVLKANVINFAGIPEEQFLALPPEARTMVMTGTNALMNNAAGPSGPPGVGVGPGMMPPVGMNAMGPMNPMMAAEMGGMGGMAPMRVGMGMGMNGDIGVGMPGPGPGPGQMMQDSQVLGQGPNTGPNGTPEQVGQMSLPDGMPPGMLGIGMNMGPEFNPMPMQDGNMQNQQMHASIEQASSSATPTPVPAPPRAGPSPASFRGRGVGIAPNIPTAPRGGRSVPTFPSGRGRGTAVLPVRQKLPLPSNVPTGPRNPNINSRYKDRDSNPEGQGGLNYGADNKDGGGGTPTEQRDRDRDSRDRERDRDSYRERERDKSDRGRDREREREEEKSSSSTRKRRSPPGNEESDRIGIGRSLRRR